MTDEIGEAPSEEYYWHRDQTDFINTDYYVHTASTHVVGIVHHLTTKLFRAEAGDETALFLDESMAKQFIELKAPQYLIRFMKSVVSKDTVERRFDLAKADSSFNKPLAGTALPQTNSGTTKDFVELLQEYEKLNEQFINTFSDESLSEDKRTELISSLCRTLNIWKRLNG
jgi:hypothetical protein